MNRIRSVSYTHLQIKSATISQVSSGKYYVSILVKTEHKELAHTNHNIGIDLGIKDLCITSDGKVYENLKIIKKYEKQLVKLQRQLSHKGKRSKNYYKTKKKIALCHEKIRNIRKDYLHKVSHEIISENQIRRKHPPLPDIFQGGVTFLPNFHIDLW